VMEIPVRMHQTRTATETGESQSGLFCQAKTTSFLAFLRFSNSSLYVTSRAPCPFLVNGDPRHEVTTEGSLASKDCIVVGAPLFIR
jgi:hypothetical protein